MSNKTKIAVVGLGYVGLPLAVEFGLTKYAPIIGFDINKKKISELKRGIESMGEVPLNKLGKSRINYHDKPAILKSADFIIVAIPTPTTKANKPDLEPLIKATEMIGKNLKKGSIVVYESTVYPGVTEEICLQILENKSGLKNKKDFKIGYSPERVNPGDTVHTIDKIVKIVSGQNKSSLKKIVQVYRTICKKGIYQAPDIKTAEAAKVIENTQRDLNIALVNELALIFSRMGIKTSEVLKAASTKWNFHQYTPGLVGGHCIGVDPYYLTYKAEELGYHPQVILAGRRINDSMAEKICQMIIKELFKNGHKIKENNVLVMGATFKENVKDIRNSKIADVIKELKSYNLAVTLHDPCFADKETIFSLPNNLKRLEKHDVIFLGVMHDQFKKLKLSDFRKICKKGAIIFDLKNHFGKDLFKNTSYTYLSL